MEKAAVLSICQMAQEEQSYDVAMAYGTQDVSFGPEYFIPKPFDSRLIARIAPAVAKAAMDDGVATRPIEDLANYTDQLQQFIHRSGAFMKPLFSGVKQLVKNGGKSLGVFQAGAAV